MFCWGIVYVCQKENWTYDGALRHTRKDSYKIRPLAIDHYALLPIFKEGFNPLQSQIVSFPVVLSLLVLLNFVNKSFVRCW